MKETGTFTSTTTRETYKINHQPNCNNKCVVHLITCKVCLKQYVGQTIEEFRLRWKNYKSNDSKYQKLESCMQQYLFEHFNIEETISTFGSEDYWSSILKTMAPLGLNVADSV